MTNNQIRKNQSVPDYQDFRKKERGHHRPPQHDEEDEDDDNECLAVAAAAHDDDDMSMDEEEEESVDRGAVAAAADSSSGRYGTGAENEEEEEEVPSDRYREKADRELDCERSAAKRRRVGSSFGGRYQNDQSANEPPSSSEYEGTAAAATPVATGRSARDELFEDTRGVRLQVDRRLEKAVCAITLDLLEAVRLGQKRLLHMLDHPRFEEYIRGTYVRYPDLELLQGEMGSRNAAENIDRFLPAQITKCLPSTNPKKLEMEGITKILPFEMTILQYTQRSDGSLKIRKTKLDIKQVSDVPFKPDELAEWRNLLRLFTGRPGSDKLQTLPEMLKATALRLKDFTFTAEDVDTILKRKSEKQSAAAGSSLLVLNWRDLYLRKSELEFQIQELRGIEEDEDFVASLSVDDSAKLHELENELKEVKKRLTVLKKEEEDKANHLNTVVGSDHKGGTIDASQVQVPSHIGRARNKVDTQMLTPRFLQAKAAVNVPSAAMNRTLDWSTLDCYKKMTRLAWTVGNVKLDSQMPKSRDRREQLMTKNESLNKLLAESLLAASSFPLATSSAPEIDIKFPPIHHSQSTSSNEVLNWNDFVEESKAKLSQRA